MKAKRIWIFGATASGKTTLAKDISKKLRMPYYSTDDFIYKKKWFEKYSDAVQVKKLKDVAKKSSWIIEGVHKNDWVKSSIDKADLIIFLNTGKLRLFSRVIKRQLGRKKSNEPGTDPLDSIKLLWWAFKHQPRHYKKYRQEKHNFIILSGPRQVNKFLRELK